MSCWLVARMLLFAQIRIQIITQCLIHMSLMRFELFSSLELEAPHSFFERFL